MADVQPPCAASPTRQPPGSDAGDEGHVLPGETRGSDFSSSGATTGQLRGPFQTIQQDIDAHQHCQLDIQARELELRREAQQAEIQLRQRQLDNQYALKQRQLEIEEELRRLAIGCGNGERKVAYNHLAEVDRARLNMAHRGQTAAIWLAYPILLGSFVVGIIIVALTIAGVVGQALGGTLGVLFVGGPLLAATAKVIQSFTGG